MSRIARNIVWLSGLTAFLLVVSGTAMFIHLSGCDNHCEHEEGHDKEHCSLCQQMLVVVKQVFEIPAFEFINSVEPQEFIFSYNKFSPISVYLEVFHSRAPPFIS